MSNHSHRKIIFWCVYCKNAIYDGEAFIVHKKSEYHIRCFKLLDADTYGDTCEE